MNLLDVVAAVVCGYGLVKGFFNGMVRELVNLLALIVSLWVGMRIAFLFADYYKGHTTLPEKYVPFLAFLSAFLLVLVSMLLVGRIVDKRVDNSALNLPNQLAGAAFGGLKWAFLLGAFYSVIGHSQYLSEETKNNSVSYAPLTGYCIAVNEYTFNQFPGAKNVFSEMKDYFLDIAHTATAPDSVKTQP